MQQVPQGGFPQDSKKLNPQGYSSMGGIPQGTDPNLRNANVPNTRKEDMPINYQNLMNNPNLQNQSGQSQQPTPQTQKKAGMSNSDPPRSRSSETAQMALENLIKGFDKEYKDLPEETRNKITFALNNCTANNIEEKANEIRPYLSDERFLSWFAKYLVYQRAPLESNFHTMYLNLIAKIGKREIFPLMMKETYKLLYKILESENVEDFNKANLKNIGSWLGQLTLARNKPIVIKDFNLKNILIDAYDNHKLDYIVPLVCKILAPGGLPDSVFKPRNAWMNAILSILAEIAEMTDIKVALKCEVEVLFRNLGITRAGDIVPSRILQMRSLQRRGANGHLKSAEGQLTINELPSYVTVDMKYFKGFSENEVKNLVAQALDRAIKDILPLVISRSVTIALITTKELILKDFALEPDERKFKAGANWVIQNLAGNLALVTCRDPLKIAFQQSLKMDLDKTDLDEQTKDAILQNTGMENLDLGCALIKKAVIEKALDDVNRDPAIQEGIERRRIAREKGQPFYDENVLKICQALPEPLRPTLGGLTRDQMRIYEEFGKMARSQPTRRVDKFLMILIF